MPQEVILQDFSGGMNASVAVDKLAKNECLLAENVRFDEQGNVLITGANALQNTATLAGGSVHSIFFDSAIGAIAGVGSTVYIGSDFTTLGTSTASNAGSPRMTFGAAPNRVYMDLVDVGYFKDTQLSDLLTVDWPPPQTSAGTSFGPNLASTGSNTAAPAWGEIWSNPSNITSTSAFATATNGGQSQGLAATGFGLTLNTGSQVQGIQVTCAVKSTSTSATLIVRATLIVGGVLTGTTKIVTLYPAPSAATTVTFGGSTDLWGIASITGAQADASNFGVKFDTNIAISSTISMNSAKMTGWQAGVGTVAGTTTAGVLTGTYSWKIAFSGLYGEESEASSPTNTLTMTSNNGTLTAIPTGDNRTAGRNVYRKGGTLTSYYLVGSIPDNATTTFLDSKTDLSALTDGIILAGDVVGDQPNSRMGNQQVNYPCYHYDRVFWAVGNKLIWSKPLNGFAYPADFETDVGDAKGITGIFSMGGELFLLKPDSIYRLSGTDENSFLLSKTLSPVGTDWPFTAVVTGGVASGFYTTGRILFANSRGLWAFNGYTSNKLTPKLDLWFRQDDRTNISLFGTSGFHSPEISSATVTALAQAAASPLFYYLAYAEAGQTALNAMLVLDLERGTISKRSFAAQSLTSDPTQGAIYGGNGSGSIFKLDDWGSANAGLGANVNLDYQDGYRDLGLRGSRFALWGLEFMLATNGQSVTPFVYFDDGTANESLGTISTSGQQPSKIYRKMASAASRYCRNFSFRLNYQGVQANSSNVPNIRLVHVKAYYEPRGARARTGEAP
jgi:hypothetical protein